jgi:hypothetical protein
MDPNEKNLVLSHLHYYIGGHAKTYMYVEQHNSLIVDHLQDNVKKVAIIYKNI